MKKNIIENHNLKLIAHELRKRIIEVSYSSGAHHIGSALSCIDILTVLYFHVMDIKIKNPFDKKRDWFMPYAPAVLVEDMKFFTNENYFSAYMQIAFKVKNSIKKADKSEY